MKKFLTIVAASMFMAPLASAQLVEADAVNCGPGEVQVCMELQGGIYKVMFDDRNRPLYDCSIPAEGGISLRCKPEDEVLLAAREHCEGLGGDWRWSRRHLRCYEHVAEPRQPDNSAGSGNAGNGSGGGCNGSSTCGSGVAVAVPRCTDVDRSRLADELDRIETDVLVMTDFRPRQERAAEIYGVLVACDDGTAESRALIQREADMIATFEPDPGSDPDYSDEFRAIRDQIAALEDRPIVVTPPAEEGNWCDENPVACGFLIAGAILAAGGVTVGVVCGVGLCEDDSGLPDHIFYR